MKSLTRTRVGGFTLKEALKLSEVEELLHQDRISDYIHPVDELFCNCLKITVEKDYDRLIHNGNSLSIDKLKETNTEEMKLILAMASEGCNAPIALNRPDFRIRIYDSNQEFIGIYQYYPAEGILKPIKMFV